MNRFLLCGALCALFASVTDGRAQTISSTQTDNFSGNSAGRVIPGNNVQYSIQVRNTGGAAATGVTLTNPTPTNTTLVPGSLRTTCLAINDVYTALGNVSITIPAGGGVLANDQDPDNTGPALTATPLVGLTSQGGNITLNADGGFTYNPPAGYEGADTFSYTLNDNDGEGNTDTATVTINVSGMIWFIDENLTSNGDGRLSAPFSNLADFQTLNNGTGNNPADNDTIFLFESASDYTGGIVLRAGQRLIGQDATSDLATLAGVTPPTGSAALPTMNSGNGVVARIVNSGGDGVTMGLNSRIHGFTAGNTSIAAVNANNVGTIHITDVIINTNGSGLYVANTSFATGASFVSISSSGGVYGIELVNASGTVNLGAGSLSGHLSDSFSASGGSGSASYAGSITKTSGVGGSGVSIASKTGGTVTLSGAISVTTASGVNGVNLTNNTGTTINLTGGVNVSTGSGSAFTATGGGTVTVTGSNNTLITSTATALNVSNTTIGANGLNFRSISANGATNGILLNNTGSAGGLTVTGTSSAGSGGTIQNCSEHGISLTNTVKVNLSWMNLTNNLGSGISGGTINGFRLDRLSISGNGNDAAADESGINLTEVTGSAFNGSNPTGITNSTISNNCEFEVQITNTSGTLTDFRLTDNTISANGLPINGNLSSPHGNLVNFLALGTANMTLTASGGSYTGNIDTSGGKTITATAIQADHSGTSGTMTADISGATITNNNVAVTVSNANGGNLAFDIHDNPVVTGSRSHGLNLFVGASATGSVLGKFRNNVVGTLGTAGSASQLGFGIRVQNEGVNPALPVTVLISGNTVQETAGFNLLNINQGIVGQATSRTTNATITGNTFRNSGARAITIQQNNNTNPTAAGTTSVSISGNTFSGIVGQAGDGTEIRLRKLDANGGVFNVTQTDLANLASVNGLTIADISIGGTPTFNQPLPPQPLLFAPGLPEVDGGSRMTDGVAETLPVSIPDSRPVRTDEAPQTAGVAAPQQPALSEAALQKLVTEAKARWIRSGLTAEQTSALDALRFEISDLGMLHLGQAGGDLVQISRTAAGNDWFIDETPGDDAEFSQLRGSHFEILHSDSVGVDLLTTLLHEMGHRLGLQDSYSLRDRSGIMYGFLTKGERRLPRAGEAAGVVPSTDANPRYLGSPLNIGTLPPGKSIIVTFQVTVNSSPTTFTSVSSQGTVSGSNFANVSTDDPDVAGAANPTVTPVEQRPTVTNITANGTEDTQLNFTAGQFTGAFNDVNGDNLASIRIASLPLNGTLRANTTALNVNDEVLAANLGTLNFVPNSNFNGSTMFTYSASDGQDYALLTATVDINIASVNDEPTLTAIPNPTAILEDAAEQTVNLAGISEGAANETGQTLTITATSDNVALIPNPTVDYTEGNATGAVRYTPVANAFGSAIITVRVQDSGGTAPGDDTIERQFTVVVNPVADTPSITDSSTLPNTQTTSGLVVSRNAVDGAEVTHYQITNIQNGSLFQNNGTTPIAANSFITHTEASAGLKFTPALNFQGDATFQLQASTSNLVGGLGGNVVTATITVSERVSIDTPNAGDNDATEGGSNNGIFTFTRGGSAGTLVANFVLDPSSTATAADFSLSGGNVAYDIGTGAGTVTFPDGQTIVQVTLTANPESPNAAEAAETVRFNVVPVAIPAPGAYQVGTPGNATVTIAQNSFLVTTTSDSGTGSLRQAVANANALAGTDTITFSDGTGGTVNFTDAGQDTITLTSGELTLTSDIVVSGNAANRVSVRSNGTSRVFQIDPGTNARLVGLTITGGGGVALGGGVMNRGTLLMLACVVSNNTASSGGAV